MFRTERLPTFVREVFLGEDAVGRARQPLPLHALEDGMVSIVTVVTVLFCIILLALLFNVSRVSNSKIETQNAADSVTYSSALCEARGMNAVTAANHVMGELTAFIVLIDALDGTERKESLESDKFDLDLKKQLIGPAALNSEARDAVEKLTNYTGKSQAGATIYDARLTLKFWLWCCLVGEDLAQVLEKFPPTSAVGTVLDAIITFAMYKIELEWEFLEVLDSIAQNLKPVRDGLEKLLPVVQAYADTVVTQTPQSVRDTAKIVAKRNGVTGVTYPGPDDLKLPVKPEPAPGSGDQLPPPGKGSPSYPSPLREILDTLNTAKDIIDTVNKLNPFGKAIDWALPAMPMPPPPEGYPGNPSLQTIKDKYKADYDTEQHSQWVRATYPWVNSLRAPIRGAMDNPLVLPFSMASRWYRNWTNRYTLVRAHEYRTRSGSDRLYLYVMEDAKPGQKGNEPWTRREGSGRADELFTVMGFVHRPAPSVVARAFNRQPNPDGMVAYAEAMIYNANDQNGQGGGPYQPEVGWDTLNWKSPVSSSGAFEFGEGESSTGASWPPPLPFTGGSSSANRPAIYLNWQAKLTPVTRLGEAVSSGQLPADKFQKVLERAPDRAFFRNH